MREKIIDDLAGMMGGAAGLISDIRDQVRNDMRDRLKVVADRIDLVTREEFQNLEDRLHAVEAALRAKGGQKQSQSKPKAKSAKKNNKR